MPQNPPIDPDPDPDRGDPTGAAADVASPWGASGLPSDDVLAAVEWSGSARFRALSYRFAVEWNWEPLGRHVRRILGGFEVAQNARQATLPALTHIPCYRLARIVCEDQPWFWVLDDRGPIFGLPGVGPTLDWFFWRLNGDLVREARDFFIVHAGAVVAPSGGGIVLPGQSGAGKSSLVAGLVRRGFGYLSDEFAAIDPVEGGLFAVPRALSLKPGSYELLDGLRPPGPDEPFRGGQWHIPSSEVGTYGGDGPHGIRWVIAPEYRPDAPVSVEPMTTAETAYTLGSHSPSVWVYGRRALPLLGDVAQHARGFRLVSGDLTEAVAAVEQLVSSEASSLHPR